MGRPSSRLKLADFTPIDFANEMVAVAGGRLADFAKAVGYTIAWDDTDPFGTKCAAICRYAQTGEFPVGSTPPPSTKELAILFGPTTSSWPELPRLVVEACWARWRIGAGDRVSVKGLALLAGLDERHVRLLGRHGHLTLGKTGVAAKEAARWLTSRGVPGFDTPEDPRTP